MARTLKRFYVSPSMKVRDDRERGGEEETVLLSQKETHYLKRVLRMKPGDPCRVFDRTGTEFLSRLDGFDSRGRCVVKLLRPMVHTKCEQLLLSVAQAIPQRRKMDEIVRKAAELGVFELIPLVTERTVIRISEERGVKVIQRWIRLAAQTLQQSRIETLPQIQFMTSFQTLCAAFEKFNQIFLFHPSREAQPIRDFLTSFPHDGDGREREPDHVLLLIGPEGGFTDREVAEARMRGAKLIRMNAGIMKTDTAFVAATSLIRCIYG